MLRSFLLLSIGLAALLATVSLQAETQPPAGFTPLFNGKDLTGWHGQPHFDPRKLAEMPEDERNNQLQKWNDDAHAHWTVDNGELVNDGKGAYLTTDESFGDVELLIEYKTVAKADSGIYLRGTPQVQIWDTTEAGGKWDRGADKGSGGLFNNAPADSAGRNPLVLADKPFGEWNQFRILQTGARTSVWLNGKLVVDHAIMQNYWDRAHPLFRDGHIQLQTHGGEIRWRNIFIRKIDTKEANALLSAREASGFASVFNGQDLTGWQGATDNYEVVDGALVCKQGKGGTLFTDDQYGDFVARLEFKLPPGGNNGLAIRYPGKGRPSVDAMTELQVIDSEHPKYAKLDPRQYHGSAYGMVAAHRGYLRPTGEWNFQEVTVVGSTIKVELNGYPILDADLSKVTEFKDGTKHPGKDLTQGYFGFAGHNDPVMFRQIQIKKLKAQPRWMPLFDGKSLAGWKSANFGGEGEVSVKDGTINMDMGGPLTGITWQKKFPKSNYEIQLEAMKVDGIDFFCGLTFPVKDSHASFIVGGWGGGVVGISSIDDADASANDTTSFAKFDQGKWYKIRVRVTDDKIEAWIDDKNLVDQEIVGKKISTRSEVDLSKPLGISAFETQAALRNLQYRLVPGPATPK